MKYLIYIVILAFLIWIASEVIEMIIGGYNPTVFFLTSAYHILAGSGIWAVHRLQAQKKNTLSAIGTAMISITYFALAYFPIQVMHSGLSVSDFIAATPVYKIPGLVSLVGFIILGISILKTKYFPPWTGFVIILGTIIYALAMSRQLQLVVNINNVIISSAIIYMAIFGYGRLDQPLAAPRG